jgi:hypothetical protein
MVLLMNIISCAVVDVGGGAAAADNGGENGNNYGVMVCLAIAVGRVG